MQGDWSEFLDYLQMFFETIVPYLNKIYLWLEKNVFPHLVSVERFFREVLIPALPKTYEVYVGIAGALVILGLILYVRYRSRERVERLEAEAAEFEALEE